MPYKMLPAINAFSCASWTIWCISLRLGAFSRLSNPPTEDKKSDKAIESLASEIRLCLQ